MGRLNGDSNQFDTPAQHLYAEPKTLTYTQDDFARPSGFTIGTPAKPNQDYAVTYDYDLAGRLDSVAAQGYTFTYGYEPNSTSDRVKTTRANGIKEAEFKYEPGRDTITSVTNQVAASTKIPTEWKPLSRYSYVYNKDGQRTSRAAEHQEEQPYHDRYYYHPDTSGVSHSWRYTGTNPFAGQRDQSQDHRYQYDKIGNRLSATSDGTTTLYEPNKLNQYQQIIGSEVTQPKHDADGNLTHQGRRSYTWDAENRLTEIRELGSLVAEYTYDHQSRRIARRVPNLNVDERYLYQGWNLTAVYNAGDPIPTETHTWGKDLSGSIQGAGGVGGLLYVHRREQGNGAWIYHYDANGNVNEITNAQGALLDDYEYDPFGGISETESQLPNRYRFSTKPQDPESKLSYYGFRYCDSDSVRWLSRDPIGEQGGINLYEFLGNFRIGRVDVLGFCCYVTKHDATFDGWNFKREGNVYHRQGTFRFDIEVNDSSECEITQEWRGTRSVANVGSATTNGEWVTDGPPLSGGLWWDGSQWHAGSKLDGPAVVESPPENWSTTATFYDTIGAFNIANNNFPIRWNKNGNLSAEYLSIIRDKSSGAVLSERAFFFFLNITNSFQASNDDDHANQAVGDWTLNND